MIVLVIILSLSFQSEYKKALNDFQNHKYKRAYKEFLQIYKKYPQNSKISNILFYLGRLEPDPDNARDYYKKIVTSHPKSKFWAESLLSLAEIDYALRRYDKVITNLNRFIKSSPGSSLTQRAHHWLNSSKSLSGEKKLAKKVKKPYIIQLGAFSNKENAKKLLNQLSKLGYQGFIKAEGGFFKVRIGFSTQGEASSALEALKEKGIKGFRVKK